MTDGANPTPTVAVPQMSVDDLAVGRNLDRIRRRLADLPDRVDVAVLPEYALTGFVADDRVREVALAREIAVDRLGSMAAANDLAVVAGYAERGDGDGDDGGDDDGDGDDGGDDGSGGEGGEAETQETSTETQETNTVYNATAYVPSEGAAEATVYRKRHLWGDEREFVTPGDGRVIVDTPAGPTGLLTCYDLNFVAESAWFTDRAVDALFVPGAWPAAHTQNWRLLLRARALDGVRWVVGAGRTGKRATGEDEGSETGHRYAGNSLVARPDGRVAAEIGREERDLIATLDRETLVAQRELVGAVGDSDSNSEK